MIKAILLNTQARAFMVNNGQQTVENIIAQSCHRGFTGKIINYKVNYIISYMISCQNGESLCRGNSNSNSLVLWFKRLTLLY